MAAAEETSREAPKQAGAKVILFSVACALLGFLVTAGLLHAAIRDPLTLYAAERGEKLEMLKQWHGNVFSAAFGSSHLHNGFDPRVFDAVLAGTPAATRSANLAIEAGGQTEQYAMAQRFLKQLVSPAQAHAAGQPCLVLLELGSGANFARIDQVSARAINVYDWQTTALATHFIDPALTATRRYGRLSFAAAGMAMHYMNVGMLSNEVFAPAPSAAVIQEQTADDRRGQLALPYRAAMMPALHQLAREIPPHPAMSAGVLTDGNAEMVKRLAAISPVRHVSFVYVVMPRLNTHGVGLEYPDHMTAAGPQGMLDVPVINLDRVDRYPELYDPELWFDGGHVNGTGAQRVTQRLAEKLKQWYAGHGGPAPCG